MSAKADDMALLAFVKDHVWIERHARGGSHTVIGVKTKKCPKTHMGLYMVQKKVHRGFPVARLNIYAPNHVNRTWNKKTSDGQPREGGKCFLLLLPDST